MSKTKLKFAVIDSNALIHRAFHALPPLTNKEGQLTNAVYGFTMILLKTLKDIKPDYIAACFDRKEKTFRHLEFEDYKAQRKKSPDELYEQIPMVKQVLESFNIPIFEKAGFEADDLIGTICHLKSVDRPDIETIIITGDQDVYQLVDDNTKVLSPHKGMSETILYDEKGIEEKFQGLVPKQLIDYKAIRGDVSDNIPGVKGIGEKGAIDLLTKFGTLENIYENIESDQIKDRTRELLKTNKDNAFLSKRLATIILDVEIDFSLEICKVGGFDLQGVLKLFQELNFKKLLSSVAALNSTKFEIKNGQGDLFSPKVVSLESEAITSSNTAEGKIKIQKKADEDYLLIHDDNEFEQFYKAISKQKEFCFDTETSGLNTFDSELVGTGFCWKKNEAYYLGSEIFLKHKKELAEIFENENIKKIGHNIKFDMEVLGEIEIKVNGVYFDTMVASYVLNPSHRQHGLENLAFVELGYQMQPIEELIGKGKTQISMKECALDKVCWYCNEDADISWQLYEKFSQDLKTEGMEDLFHKLEMPLVQVLAKIEKNGVKIDSDFLNKQSKKLGTRIKKIEKEVFELVGEEFNLSSPLQLKNILFNKLGIDGKGLGKTKTGTSTGAAQLEKLLSWLGEKEDSTKEIKIVNLIMEHRELAKLKSTYLDSLPKLVNVHDGRVHTSFNQTVTATGRLSSSNPNLQNIPIRTEVGQEIRKAFIAEEGFKLVKADYSQIELRIVASLAEDKDMLEIFNSGGDIHTSTAAFIHEVEEKEVTKEMRRQAKEVNFGVLYGMGSWGLAQRTGISASRAQEFITKYFLKYKGVKKYIADVLESAQEKGYVETLYGRRRPIPEINSGIQQVRAGAERIAINMPVQGTAADLIKFAMIEIQNKLHNISPKSRMILQVHDELVFEVPEKDVKKVAEFVADTMCSVIKLKAPIEAEVSAGDNWGETEKVK
ncbi:MAG: DNA polymerase I [Candidatus Buchananbacteria bacterium]